MYVAHSRFYKGMPVIKGEKYDRVVTSCWFYDKELSVLTYGATVYKKISQKDNWVRKIHREKAEERFINNPVCIKLDRYRNVSHPRKIAIEWFIADNFIWKYGCEGKTELHPVFYMSEDFNKEYTYLKYRKWDNREISEKKMNQEEKCMFFWIFTSSLTLLVGIALYTYS